MPGPMLKTWNLERGPRRRGGVMFRRRKVTQSEVLGRRRLIIALRISAGIVRSVVDILTANLVPGFSKFAVSVYGLDSRAGAGAGAVLNVCGVRHASGSGV